jgi:hypothetical protein
LEDGSKPGSVILLPRLAGVLVRWGNPAEAEHAADRRTVAFVGVLIGATLLSLTGAAEAPGFSD